MSEKAARPELGTVDNPRYMADSRMAPFFTVRIKYNGNSAPVTMQATGVDLKDGCFLIAKPVLSTRLVRGEWVRLWINEVFMFVNIVEVVELEIEREG